jgi:CDP-glucose 4,6-dehydratase
MENMEMTDSLSIYKGKKVFITGHTGFKGSWLAAMLHHAGAKVKGYALEPEYQNSLHASLQPFLQVESIIADIRDKHRLSKEIASFHPDFIFHLAAQPLVRRSYEIPAETFEVNVVGTANLLESIISLPGKCSVVIVTTDKVYDNKEQHILYNESDMLGGHDPYSASKACTELVVSSFRNSFFSADFQKQDKSIASARAGNVIGGGDWSKDRIIPDIVRSLQENKSIEIRNPNAVRPWQHVLEPLAGYLLLGEKLYQQDGAFSRAFNFGPEPDDHLTVSELVQEAISCWGSGNWTNKSEAQQPHEAGLLKLDIKLAKDMLGWRPKLSAVEAVEWTINWYHQPANKKAEFTFHQIREFLAL